MTTFRDRLGETLAIGERVRVTLEKGDDGTLVAAHPNDSSPLDIAVVEGVAVLEEEPPTQPVEVELLPRTVDGRIAARVVDSGQYG
ncbi:hypothetical protein [Natronorubrum daqingense]|uniref:TRAM domain-containing protein n=1 Tax=Natronorubrum daqingense TaxID=588898 RepID=A0A1N7E120_9EURY|nr:hypothetical protein [Natronorubrum daqingense]APX96291.1 hypothetical protein BB347_06475 [Natronorubrum daqingense]SIR81741.1 hypothetical protein SAMN05421809_2381 [Natronorubrum daqingense]